MLQYGYFEAVSVSLLLPYVFQMITHDTGVHKYVRVLFLGNLVLN
jgi:hypothetical protein